METVLESAAVYRKSPGSSLVVPTVLQEGAEGADQRRPLFGVVVEQRPERGRTKYSRPVVSSIESNTRNSPSSSNTATR